MTAALLYLAGVATGGGALYAILRPGSPEGAPSSFLSVIREAKADLEDGEYQFLPNRRSVWIVNRTNGRMANYLFRDDELGSVDRSRVATMDMKSFPRKDTVLMLSDRNMNNILWVGNTRTGDVQMWTLGRDGAPRAEPPIQSSTDLMEHAQGAKAGAR